MIIDGKELSDSLKVDKEPESSRRILEAIEDAEKAFESYMAICRTVDRVYSLSTTASSLDVTDQTFALFWSSIEILKPAIYAKPPKPVAQPRFKDAGNVEKTVAELLERTIDSSFERDDIDQVMLHVRDDLALTNRGVAWVMYETDRKGGGQRVCIDHIDRTDFLHEPARKWSEVGWVARRAWLTLTQMKARFKSVPHDVLMQANFSARDSRDDSRDDYGMHDSSSKAGVWEVWHRSDNKVYWVTPGINTILEEGDPHLNLDGFFPCPRPAYGTISRRSLIPVPDYRRYQYHLDQINILTARVYTLLDHIKMKVFIPAGGDVAEAVKTAVNSVEDSIIIPVPGAALTATTTNMFVMLPLQEIAQTIAGLIEARGQLIEDFYQLSGISDIMRGATESEETLGAQRLKSQYGSVRVRDKIDELQRLARDCARIAAEIMADNFTKETFLEISQMDIPSQADIKKQIKEVEDRAKEALKAAAEQIKEAASQQQEPVDPAEIQLQYQQQQQQIIMAADQEISRLSNAVTIEAVMKMLRDTHGRHLVIDIETDSTVLTDEMAEKQSRAQFLEAITGASASLQMFLQAREPGRKLAGGLLKFAMQPFRASREIDALIDDFVDTPLPEEDGEGDAEAMTKLAEAEVMKGQAQIAKVEADSQIRAAELQQKQAQMETDMQEKAARYQLEAQKLEQKSNEMMMKYEELQAKIDNLRADTMKKVAEAGVIVDNQLLDEFKSLADIDLRANDQAMRAEGQARQDMLSERQQELNERSAQGVVVVGE